MSTATAKAAGAPEAEDRNCTTASDFTGALRSRRDPDPSDVYGDRQRLEKKSREVGIPSIPMTR